MGHPAIDYLCGKTMLILRVPTPISLALMAAAWYGTVKAVPYALSFSAGC
jgi:hypothetical protein